MKSIWLLVTHDRFETSLATGIEDHAVQAKPRIEENEGKGAQVGQSERTAMA
jgi:hypothetical protein